MKVLVACEMSGVVRDVFCDAGHNAWSCDLLGPETHWDAPDPLGTFWRENWNRQRWPGHHLEGDVAHWIKGHPAYGPWDMLIGFPPCTHIAVSGARWFKHKIGEQRAALEFMRNLLEANIPRIAIENPIGIFSSWWRKPDQIIQPWQFGHGETKATCLWLKNLPKLVPTKIVDGRAAVVHRMAPGPMRAYKRSLTYLGIAAAMAAQWGALK